MTACQTCLLLTRFSPRNQEACGRRLSRFSQSRIPAVNFSCRIRTVSTWHDGDPVCGELLILGKSVIRHTHPESEPARNRGRGQSHRGIQVRQARGQAADRDGQGVRKGRGPATRRAGDFGGGGFVIAAKDKATADAMIRATAQAVGIADVEAARNSPLVLAGTFEDLKRELAWRVENFGMTYYFLNFQSLDAMETFAKEVMPWFAR